MGTGAFATTEAPSGAAFFLRRAPGALTRPSSALALAAPAVGGLDLARTRGAASRKTISVALGTSTPSLPVLRFAIVRAR